MIIGQQREQARQRQLEQSPASITIPPTSETAPDIRADTPIGAIVETGPTFAVQRIALQTPDGKPFEPPAGISGKLLDAVVKPFVGHDLGSHRINVLLKRLTHVFVERGFVTIRALLGPQNLATGTLKVTIQVGLIETFTVNGKSNHRLKPGESSSGGGWVTDAGYENAFPASSSAPLRLSDVEIRALRKSTDCAAIRRLSRFCPARTRASRLSISPTNPATDSTTRSASTTMAARPRASRATAGASRSTTCSACRNR
ncbi:POTRA domain-containing protein [Burkholderia ubonensis]|uniref:POTRA domain-containing protein n=1 Tax=Burkholderia ubonensis TaxID=101571 RepID=UPI000AF77194